MFFPIASTIFWNEFDTIIKNRKLLTVARDRKSSICAESETSYRQKRDIKKEEAISVKESRPRRAILGNSNPGFGPERPRNARGSMASK